MAKLSGDIRVAFDVIKGAIVKKLKMASDAVESDPSAKVLELTDLRQITIMEVNEIFQTKHESKLGETFKTLPPVTQGLLKTLFMLVKTPENMVQFNNLFMQQRMNERKMLPSSSQAEVKESLSQLESYGIVVNETNKKGHKVGIKADFEELRMVLESHTDEF